MMVDFMKWALTDGQKFAPDLGYAPLPADVVKLEMAALARDQGVSRRALAFRRCASDLGFRLGTGLFALLAGPDRRRRSASSSARQSLLSIQKFGLQLLADRHRGTRSPASSARCPFIWGTLYSSVLALLIATPIALGIAIFISELCPAWLRAAAGVPHRAARRDSLDRLRPVGHLRAGAGGARSSRSRCRTSLRELPLFSGPPLGVGMLSAALILADHGDPVHLVGRARSAEGRAAGAARGRLRARRHAMGGDPRGALLRAHRHHRRRSCSASAARSARPWR